MFLYMRDHCKILLVKRHNRYLDLVSGSNKLEKYCARQTHTLKRMEMTHINVIIKNLLGRSL